MKRTKQNEGVALIVVLGFLSLMLVLAVSFLSEARTERTVSDYSLEAFRARQLLRTALAAAQNDYSEALWDTRKALPDADWEVFTSEASGVDAISGKQGTLGGSGTIITNGKVLDWIPARYKTKDVFQEMEDAEWILVREEPGKSSRILGRYAYICLDSSGGLDANWVAREDEVANRDTSRSLTNRPHHSVREVPMGLLPEVADANQFKHYRMGWKGFDSLQTLVWLTDGVFTNGTKKDPKDLRWQPDRIENGSAGLTSNLVSDLVSYSLTAYRGGRYHRGSGTWDKPNYMDPATGGGWEAVLAPLQGQGWNPSDLQKQLDDYLHKGAPQGVDYPSIKAVPMFNEMWIKNLEVHRSDAMEGEGTNQTYKYSAKVTVGFETWFPFPSEDNKGGTYRIDAPTVSMQSSSGSGIWIPVALQLSSGTIQQVKGIGDPDKPYLSVEATYGKPKTAGEFVYTVNFETTKAVTDPNATLMWRVGWTVQDAIDLKNSSGVKVDQLAKGVKFPIATQIIDQQSPLNQTFSMEVTDPRLNHLSEQWQKADTDAGSPNDYNTVLKQLPDYEKEGEWMYCRDGKMESLAEFGYFSTGKPWQTLDLCTKEGSEFLALGTLDKHLYDAVRTNGVFYTNATININTYRTNVLASAFYDLSFMPTPNTHPDKIAKENAFTEAQAREIAKRIQAETAKEPYQSGQDWANTSAMKDGGYLDGQHLTRTERESVLRNTDGLFSVSDSLFTVILIAQSVKEGPDSKNIGKWDDEDQVTGERRGVALVWRDPYKTGNNLHHEMMVRMFRFLND